MTDHADKALCANELGRRRLITIGNCAKIIARQFCRITLLFLCSSWVEVRQCDQIGRFLKFLVKNVFKIVAQIFGHFWDYF